MRGSIAPPLFKPVFEAGALAAASSLQGAGMDRASLVRSYPQKILSFPEG
jgi:hypothetical protein